jgi:prepilin-type N-terminal cleavage/methylation domain-containing protein
MQHAPNSTRGFTLMELMVAAAVGLIVTGGAVTLFTQGMKASFVASQKSEMQQDFRAAVNLLQRDISMAGAGALGQQGLGGNAVALPTGGTSVKSVYPCTSVSNGDSCTYINGTAVAYPNSLTGTQSLYSIIPGTGLGITVSGNVTDIITVVYADGSLALNCYVPEMNVAATVITFQLPTPLPSTCILPSNVVAPQSLIYSATNAAGDSSAGLQVGDMILFGTNAAVGVVSGAATSCTPTAGYSACYSVPFAAGDPGHINQPTVATGSLLGLTPSVELSSDSPVRLVTVTYYLAIPPSTGLPTLMRLQSGRPPAPVAENVVDLKFTFDETSNGITYPNQTTLIAGTTPAQITQINIAHLTMRSQMRGLTGYQGFDLQTSISARNLTFGQEYPIN